MIAMTGAGEQRGDLIRSRETAPKPFEPRANWIGAYRRPKLSPQRLMEDPGGGPRSGSLLGGQLLDCRGKSSLERCS